MHLRFALLACTLLFATALSRCVRAACDLAADLPKERVRTEHELEVRNRQLEKARADLKLKNAAYEAATAELAKNPEDSESQVRAAAGELRDAEDTRKSADDLARAAEEARDCVLRQMQWAGSITVPIRIAGGAGERWMLGVGLRLNLRTTNSPRELHHFGVDLLSLHNFGFNEREYEAVGTGQRALSAYYEYRYKNLIIGPAAALRVSKRSNDGEMNHPNAWLIGHIGFDVDAELTLPRVCSKGCFITAGSLFVEPWFPMGSNVPVSVVVGLELQFGGGWGESAKKSSPTTANVKKEVKAHEAKNTGEKKTN